MNAPTKFDRFNVHEAKTQFSKLVARVEAGEEIVIARAGKPVARLVPIVDVPKKPRQPGGWPELANVPDSVWFDPLPEDELELWEGKRLEKYGL